MIYFLLLANTVLKPSDCSRQIYRLEVPTLSAVLLNRGRHRTLPAPSNIASYNLRLNYLFYHIWFKNIFAYVKGSKKCIFRSPEFPLILLNYNGTNRDEKAFFSFAKILRVAMQTRIDSMRDGFMGYWVRILDPIERITEKMYEEYIIYTEKILTQA